MDSLSGIFSDFNGYYVALIIITIVTIAIGIALSFFFVFIPALRAERTFDILENRAEISISNVTNLINTVSALSGEAQQDACESIIYTMDTLFGKLQNVTISPPPPPKRGCIIPLYCINKNPLIPSICKQYINPADIPSGCPS